MSVALILACLWVLTATAVAFLPMRYQYPPGLALLLAAPVLLAWMAVEHGWPLALIGFLGFVSMFRRPLGYLAKRVLGSQEGAVE